VPRDGLAERIEVDANEVERLNLVLLERREVVRLIAPGQDCRVDPRVERPPLETISTSRSAKPWENSSRPDLSCTEISARLITPTLPES
jgi:hypothetical protein